MKKAVFTIVGITLLTASSMAQWSFHEPKASPRTLGVAINVCDFVLYDVNAQVVYRPFQKFGIMGYFAHGNKRSSEDPTAIEEFRYEVGPRYYVTSDDLIFVQATFSYIDANVWSNSEEWNLVERGGVNYYELVTARSRDDISQTGISLSVGTSFELYRFVYMEFVATYGFRWTSINDESGNQFYNYRAMGFAGYDGPVIRFQGLIGFNLF
ncbi:MAG: hypothetical protein HWE14_14710 [Flavobacteriia bacterium]|nr:hypothetical protein [Flavobacteriia bacterium]